MGTQGAPALASKALRARNQHRPGALLDAWRVGRGRLRSRACAPHLFGMRLGRGEGCRQRPLLTWRRDVRHFRRDRLPAGAVERLIELAALAPSVELSQPWRFVIVD